MKKTTALMAVFLCLIPTTSKADVPKNIVVIDTGYDASEKTFIGKIVYEKCVSSSLASCPNGTVAQEGAGSAALTPAQLSLTNAKHGTEMLMSSLYANPNQTFVYVRSVFFSKTLMYSMTDNDLSNILAWVVANKDKLNVGAVAISAARQVTSCPANVSISASVLSLKNSNIPVIAASGNNYDYKNTGFPACLNNIISVGSTDDYGISLYSNISKDFYARGTLDLVIGGIKQRITGTSEATQVFAADWILLKQIKSTLTFDQEYSLIKSSSLQVKNTYLNGLAINITKAIQ